MLVLEGDIEGNILRLCLCLDGWWKGDAKRRFGGELGRWAVGDRTVHFDRAFCNERLDPRTAQIGRVGQRFVEAGSALRLAGDDFAVSHC